MADIKDQVYEGLASLAYVVVRITAGVNGSPHLVSHGTGWCYSYEFEDGKHIPVIVTNKHVLLDRPWLTFSLAALGPDGRREMGPSIDVTINAGEVPMVGHPDPSIDLAIIALNPIMTMAKERSGRDPAAVVLGPGNALPTADYADTHIATQVLMIGFPTGLMDEVNNLPITRRGTLATPLASNYKGRPDFAVDIAAYGGSSGSPVFAFYDGFRMRNGMLAMQGQQCLLIGILHSGPVMTAQGELVEQPVPTISVPITNLMINIGYCAKAHLLNDFGSIIAGWVGQTSLPKTIP